MFTVCYILEYKKIYDFSISLATIWPVLFHHLYSKSISNRVMQTRISRRETVRSAKNHLWGWADVRLHGDRIVDTSASANVYTALVTNDGYNGNKGLSRRNRERLSISEFFFGNIRLEALPNFYRKGTSDFQI